jgi:methyl-accepting chemotaxis protein
MNITTLLQYAKGKLFQLMIGAITVGVLLLSVTAIYLTVHNFDSLSKEVGQSLQAGRTTIKKMLDGNLDQVSASVTASEKEASKVLVDYLSNSVKSELDVTRDILNESLLDSANTIATMLASVSTEAILSKKFSTLVSYVKVAHRNPQVVYAVFLRPEDNSPLTRYVNRRNPLVKELIAKGEGRTPLEKLFSAAAADPNIKEIIQPIMFEDKQLGSVRLGVSVQHVKTRMAEMESRFDKLVNNSEAKVTDSLSKVADAIATDLQTNFALVNKQIVDSNLQAEETIKSSAGELIWTQIGTMALIGALILSALCFFFLLRVISPINLLRATMQDIAAGEGDLTQRLPQKGNDEINQVAVAFNLFVSKIQKTLIKTSETTTKLNEATAVLSDLARQNSDNVNRQRAETQQVATAVTEMAATVKEIAQSADNAASAARDANSEAFEVKEAMRETSKAIDTMATEVTNAAQAINRLENDSESIGSVLNVIRGIADQTNLLALNAAIEAARAGEQGRGFAVVADEVRTLAKRTQESTAEINSIINNLQSGTREAVQVMSDGLEAAKLTVEKSEHAGEALNNIVHSVSTIMDMNTQIATASEQHTTVTEELNRSVVQISEVSDAAADGSNKTADKSRELSGLGEELTAMVTQFKL